MMPHKRGRMSWLAIAFATWSALTGLVSVIMALARTSPDDAVSNLSKWAKRAGLHDIPQWLRNQRADEIAYHWAKISLIVLITIGALGGGAYFLTPSAPPNIPTVPPSSIPLADKELHGWLKPAAEQTPPNGCDRHARPEALKVIIGDNAIANDRLGKFTALEIGSCEAISMEREKEGVFVYANVYDEKGSQRVVRIVRNEVFTLSGENYSSRMTQDSSSLTVKGSDGDILLFIKYLNTTTILVRGTFGCSAKRTVVIRDDQPIRGMFMHNSCIMGQVGIHIE
jgi:hypothetical protein